MGEELDPILIGIAGVVVIALASAIAPRLRIPPAILLVIVGITVSFLPMVPLIQVDPEIILVGILPPLLYSAAVSLPAIEFRRDLGAVAGLAVFLVVITSVALGLLFNALMPALGLYLAIALGAILSPTDAVATGIVKRLGISRRVTTLLEGESLLNDATALVLLTTMVSAFTSGREPGSIVTTFLWGVFLAAVVGGIIGWITLRVRAWVGVPAANTAIGFVAPFAAYLPTEHFGGSGLVAAVVAGIVTGQGAARWFTPEQRLSDKANWKTIELVLEGAVFLIMGLELEDVIEHTDRGDAGLLKAAALALLALGVVLLVRAAWVAALLWAQGLRARAADRRGFAEIRGRLAASGDAFEAVLKDRATRTGRPAPDGRRLSAMRNRFSRMIADMDYYQSSPLGWKHGSVIVWAGMRGVVTLAAAQTLPRDAPERPTVVFIAFVVAAVSLFAQSVTLPMLVRWLRIDDSASERHNHAETDRIRDELRTAASAAIATQTLARPGGEPFDPDLLRKVAARFSEPPPEEDGTETERELLEMRLAVIEVQRSRLLELSSGGVYSSSTLRRALEGLDADQLSIQVRIDGVD